MTVKTDVTVYIGRFNPFHLGHAYVLEQALKTSRLVIVLVGSSDQARSLKNPFTFEERKTMIQQWWANNPVSANSRLVIGSLRDHPYNNALWIQEVQAKVRGHMTLHAVQNNVILTDITLTGSDRDDSTWYLSAFPQWKSNLLPEYKRPPNSLVSATSIRETLFANEKFDWASIAAKVTASTADFLMEFKDTPACALLRKEHETIRDYRISWSVAPYAPTFVTTDAIVVQSGHVLVIERGSFPGMGLWALPGGFLNQNEYLQDGAIRELIEETGISLAEGKKSKELTISILKGSIKEKEIFDKPDRSLRGRTITTAFLFRLDDTKPLPRVKGQNMPLHETGGKAVVETAKAFWLPISDALMRSDKWFEDHHAILETMIGGRD